MEALILIIIMGVGLIGLAVSSALLYSTYHPKQEGFNKDLEREHRDLFFRKVKTNATRMRHALH